MRIHSKKTEFIKELLKWGVENRDDYPWRETQEPYKVLVAELMLQRTKAEQVIPVYTQFIKKFPDLEALAYGEISDVAGVIRPLGLVYRAARFREIAKDINSKHSGGVPDDADALLELKGIGNYVANAVKCFAYNHDIAIVDANIARIVKRVFSLDFGPDAHKKQDLWRFMQSLVPSGRAKEFNWTLIDFGNAVCTVRNPKCKSCPLNTICDYYARSKTSD